MSHDVTFRTVLGIDQMFKVSNITGKKGKIEHICIPMNWFYFGFKRRYYLSNRKLSSVGQKLPNWWEMHICDL